MTVETMNTLRLTRKVAATPQAAFDAWTQPERMKHWACPEGVTLENVVSEVRVGGAFKLFMRSPEGETFTAFGTYREVDPPQKVVYTWDWEEESHAVGNTVVSVTFEAVEGGTEVVLTHEGFPAAEAKDAHEQGWTSCLARYTALVG